jgi:hypothetical protein
MRGEHWREIDQGSQDRAAAPEPVEAAAPS